MDFREMANDPEHKRRFEALLYLAAQRGDADLVAERLSWGVDPDCHSKKKRRTPLLANVVSCCPSAAVLRALIAAGADPHASDIDGLTALDVARRKLAKIERTGYAPAKSPSLDENDQLQLPESEQEELDRMRARLGDGPEARVRSHLVAGAAPRRPPPVQRPGRTRADRRATRSDRRRVAVTSCRSPLGTPSRACR